MPFILPEFKDFLVEGYEKYRLNEKKAQKEEKKKKKQNKHKITKEPIINEEILLFLKNILDSETA